MKTNIEGKATKLLTMLTIVFVIYIMDTYMSGLHYLVFFVVYGSTGYEARICQHDKFMQIILFMLAVRKTMQMLVYSG